MSVININLKLITSLFKTSFRKTHIGSELRQLGLSSQAMQRYKKQRTMGPSFTVSAPSIGNSATVAKGKSYKRGTYKKNKSLVNLIHSVIRNDAEKKEVLTNIGYTAGATQSNVTLVSGVGQGTTGITRVGLEVTHAYLEVDLMITNSSLGNTTGPYDGDAGFWAIVLDRQPNGALATFASMFDDSLALGQGIDFRITTTNQDRFKVISRNEWSVGCSCATAVSSFITGAAPYHVKEYIDLSKLGKGNPLDQKANFSSSGATIAAIDSGALLFVVAGTKCDADNQDFIIGQCKYRFSDL